LEVIHLNMPWNSLSSFT